MEGMTACSHHWRRVSGRNMQKRQGFIRNEQSSPGYLQVGQVPSKATRQIPQTSSSGISQRHEATAFHSLIVTFMLGSSLLIRILQTIMYQTISGLENRRYV